MGCRKLNDEGGNHLPVAGSIELYREMKRNGKLLYHQGLDFCSLGTRRENFSL